MEMKKTSRKGYGLLRAVPFRSQLPQVSKEESGRKTKEFEKQIHVIGPFSCQWNIGVVARPAICGLYRMVFILNNLSE